MEAVEMSIQQLSRERFFSVTDTQRKLRPGQIVQGKILKIYPNNKAQIQLGSQQMVAQLEAPLAVANNYHFQVKSVDDVIHLKILGKALSNRPKSNLTNLIQSLNLKMNRTIESFLQTIINEGIPFDKNELSNAIELLNNKKGNARADQVIKTMMVKNLPMTSSVFNALHTNLVTDFSTELHSLLAELKKSTSLTPLKQTLINNISQLVEPQVTNDSIFNQAIIGRAVSDEQSFFSMLKLMGILKGEVDFSTWKSYIETDRNSHSPTIGSNLTNPVLIEESAVTQLFEQISSNYKTIQNESTLLLLKWGEVIRQSLANRTPLPTKQFAQIKRDIVQNIIPLFTSEHSNQLSNIQNVPAELENLHRLMQTFTNSKTFTIVDQFLSEINKFFVDNQTPIKDQLLMQMRQTLLFTGLNYEHSLIQDITNEDHLETIKSMLIKLTNQGNNIISERAQQLLHFINGLQIQSVYETNDFIQASLLVPGEKVNLNNDLYLDFESNKTEDGEINPDYCRILFYLDLSHLQETIIDMNIQKRIISLTVFNNNISLKRSSDVFEHVLKDNLLKLDYELATITFKPLEQNETQSKSKLFQSRTYKPSYEGFDFKV